MEGGSIEETSNFIFTFVKLQSWTKLLRQNKKFSFQQKKTPAPKSMLFGKSQAFDNKTLPDSTLM